MMYGRRKGLSPPRDWASLAMVQRTRVLLPALLLAIIVAAVGASGHPGYVWGFRGSGYYPGQKDLPNGPLPTVAGAPASGSPTSDRLALIALYISTDGPNWDNNDEWPGRAPLGKWHGVGTENGRVTTLRLSGNGLNGELPAELAKLDALRELHLDNNQLRGQIPPELGGLSNLTALSLANNQFTGCVSVPLLRVAANDLDSLNLPACSPVQVETESIPSAHNPAEDFDILAGEGPPEGIWSDGTPMWVLVVAQGEEPARIYAYGLASKQRVPERDFNTLAGAGNDSPEALWYDGTTLWVADSVDGKIYAYDLATTQRVPGRDFESLGDPGHLSLTPRGIRSDGATLWEAESGGHKVFAYSMDSKARIPGQDFNTLGDAGNRNPEGIWADGKTMWVADIGEAALYAYALSSRARTGDRDFRTLAAAGNESPGDIWSDGATMWVVDNADRKIYAYHMPTPAAEETPQPQPELEEMFPDIHPDDLEALRAFYDSIDEDAGLGETWFVPGGSLKSWKGIETEDGRVTALELNHSGLKGTLPPELGNLEKLERLNLRFNQLSGRILQELGNLKNLELLDLKDNGLAGEIPVELSGLNRLGTLNLSENNLEGSFQDSGLADLLSVERLELRENELGGTLPKEWQQVERVEAAANKLAGIFRIAAVDIRESSQPLVYLDLSNNNLEGPIPTELGDFKHLRTLNLSYNKLQWHIDFGPGGWRAWTAWTFPTTGLAVGCPTAWPLRMPWAIWTSATTSWTTTYRT